MTINSSDLADPDFIPPPPPAILGLPRWIVAPVALVTLVLILVVGAWQAYLWLVDDMAHRRAVAEQALESPPDASGSEAASTAWSSPHDPTTNELSAPAVIGGSVNRCLTDGHLIYTNTPGPEGSRAAAAGPASVDPGYAAGFASKSAPADLSDSADDASQQTVICNFLAAEISRLDYEFRQPLPPPVLDDISSRLTWLRTQLDAARCNPPTKPATSTSTRRRAP
jgi:hypothetical protein